MLAHLACIAYFWAMKKSFTWIYSRTLFDAQTELAHESRLIAALLLLALALRLIGITYGLPATYNSTEYYIAKQAMAMGARHSLEPLFYVYPTLYIYLIAVMGGILFIGGLILGLFHTPEDFAFQFLVNPTFFYLSGRLLSAAFFLTSLYFLYKTLRFYLTTRLSLVFALFFLFSWNIQFFTFWMVPDGLLILGTILVTYLVVRAYHYPHRQASLLLAAFLAGLTVSAKYTAGFLPLLPLLAPWMNPGIRRRWRLTTGMLALVVLGFLLGTPYWVIRFQAYYRGLQMLLTQSIVDWNTGSGVPVLWELSTLLTSDWGMGLLVIIGLALSFGTLTPQHRKELPFALVIVPTFLVVSLMQKKGLDYLLIIFPLSLILTGAWLSQTQWLRTYEQQLTRWGALVLLPGMFLVGHLKYQQTQPDTRQLASQWIQTHIPQNALLCYDNYHFDLSLLDIERFTRRGFGARFLSPRLKERLAKLKHRPDVYRFTPIRHQFDLPQWPTQFSPEQIVTYMTNPFLVEAYQHPFKTLADLQAEGVEWLIVNGDWAAKFQNPALLRPENPLYPLYQTKVAFYQTLFQNYQPVVTLRPNWQHPGPTIFIFSMNSH